MRLVGETISVSLDASHLPSIVRWRLSLYRVAQVEEQWVYVGKWWTTPSTMRGQHRRYYRLSCLTPSRTSICLEIYRSGQTWMLSRMLD